MWSVNLYLREFLPLCSVWEIVLHGESFVVTFFGSFCKLKIVFINSNMPFFV